MIESVVQIVVEKFTSLLWQETKLLNGARDEIASLQLELERIRGFLREYEDRICGNQIEEICGDEAVKNWVKQLRDAAYDAEDIIDEFAAVNALGQREANVFQRVKTEVFVLSSRFKVAKSIKDIKRRIRVLGKNRDDCRIRWKQSTQIPNYRYSSTTRHLPAQETEMVGINSGEAKLIKRLIGGGCQQVVLPIVGCGGIGKTTLAKRVYEHPIFTSYFDFRAWVCVSQNYSLKELLLGIMRSAMVLSDEMIEMSEEALSLELFKYLRTSRYLIVLDDVWEENLLEKLSYAFARNPLGSRVIVTTRSHKVASHMNPHAPPLTLTPLTVDESWELLCNKVFQGGDCPPELEKIGVQIAQKCGGLPLAVVTIAGILANKERTVSCWSAISSSLVKSTDQVSEILALSYNSLPYHLKPCFLYCGIFPEDYEIKAERLIKLWVAEGFVQQCQGEELEDVAQLYLNNLIHRSLIQVAGINYDGSVKSCRIHDLLRDLCIYKAKQEELFEVRELVNPLAPYNTRRLGIHSNPLRYIHSNPLASKRLRSFLSLSLNKNTLSADDWKSLFRAFRLLRVLDLLGVKVDKIPTEIGALICLRYLRLRSPTARDLPTSICNLFNLETFEVIAPCIYRLPLAIWKLRQLRHLNFSGQVVIEDPPENMAKSDQVLKNLLTLSNISPDSCTDVVLSKFPNLVKLGILGDIEKLKDMAFGNLKKLCCLRSLKLVRDGRSQKMNSLPSWVEFPPKLTKLTLSETQLSADPMKELGQLPNLLVLKLTHGAYIGTELNCPTNSFLRLKVLKLINLGITNWHISAGSMLSLVSIVIDSCECLASLPSSLKNMSTLQRLELWWPSVSLAKFAKGIADSKPRDQFQLLIYHSEIETASINLEHIFPKDKGQARDDCEEEISTAV